MKTFLNIETKIKHKISTNKKTGEKTNITICKTESNYNFPTCLYLPDFFKSNTFTGVAKCSPEDENNELYAEKLATTRAKIKAYKHYRKHLKKEIIRAKKELEFLESVIDNINYIIDHEQIHENDLLINEESYKAKINDKKNI